MFTITVHRNLKDYIRAAEDRQTGRRGRVYLRLLILASLGVMAETHVGSGVVFGASVRGLAGARGSKVRRASRVPGGFAGLRWLARLGGQLRGKTEQGLPLLGL